MKKILTLTIALMFCACASTENQQVKQTEQQQQTNQTAATAPTAAANDETRVGDFVIKKQNVEPTPAPPSEKKGTVSNPARKGSEVTFDYTVEVQEGLISISRLVADCGTNNYKVVYRTLSSNGNVIKRDETLVENNNPNEDAKAAIQKACGNKAI